MLKKQSITKFKLFFLLLGLLFSPTLIFAAEDWDWNWQNIDPKPELVNDKKINIDANSLFVVDLNTDYVLYNKNITHVQPIASITKLMTAVVLLENYKPNETITVSYRAASINGSKMHLQTNEQICIKDIVYGLIISSANDAAASVEDFFGQEKIVGLMNKKAQELGLKNTKFQDAIGLSKNNISSALDLYHLSNYALKKTDIAEAAKQIEYTIESASGQQHIIHTTNRLLKQYNDVYGLKTGYTEEAGNCLITLSIQNQHSILSIMLGSPDYDRRFSDSRDLINWVFNSFNW